MEDWQEKAFAAHRKREREENERETRRELALKKRFQVRLRKLGIEVLRKNIHIWDDDEAVVEIPFRNSGIKLSLQGNRLYGKPVGDFSWPWKSIGSWADLGSLLDGGTW